MATIESKVMTYEGAQTPKIPKKNQLKDKQIKIYR